MTVVQTATLNSSLKIQILCEKTQTFSYTFHLRRMKMLTPQKPITGNNPEHLALAKQELSTLLSKGLIETIASTWACEAFYVNKHAEQV